MAVGMKAIASFDEWYETRREGRDGELTHFQLADCATHLASQYDRYKRDTDVRLKNYDKLVKLVDNEVISPKADLPNISSGETAGMIRRMARNLVQHTPNVDVTCKFDDDAVPGIFARHMLKTRIIGDDQYSNDMQQNLFASAKSALTLGFDAVIPALLQDAAGSWFVKYDTIFYRDVFPEPGVKDVRDAADVFVRRYLTKGDVAALVRQAPAGWDVSALKGLLETNPPSRDTQSVDKQTSKHGTTPEGYELITWYSSSGQPFLTFDGRSKMLLRIEKNKHPLKWHPVFFLVLEKDAHQPFGKSQAELLLGRQEFQDLMFNGAMKLWYRNINPSIIAYGAPNAAINLSPGKLNGISNPNAKIEAFEVNTQSLLQYGQISAQNQGSMVQLVGAADQQMATQSGAGGMSATPQGVEAQQAMVDITTNNYQKAIESFFSRYCSYALTIYFQELKSIKAVTPTADARKQLLGAGMPAAAFEVDGSIKIDFEELATEYWVRAVPGSLVELEDERQIRLLNQMFVPLSQAMPALAQTGDQQVLAHAAAAMQFIVQKQLELSGSAHSADLKAILSGKGPEVLEEDARRGELEARLGEVTAQSEQQLTSVAAIVAQLQEQQVQMREANAIIMQALGIPMPSTAAPEQALAV